jgi:transposase InsO family protein
MRWVLKTRKLWGYVEGRVAKPVDQTSPDFETWTNNDQQAAAQIILTLRAEPKNSVRELTTSKAMWDRLVERYQGRGLQTIVFLQSDFFTTKFGDEKDMQTQINQLATLKAQLGSLGVNIEDSTYATALIIALPSSYQTTKTFLMSKDTLTADEVISNILSYERQLKRDGDSALKAKQIKRFGGQKFNKSNDNSSNNEQKSSKPKCDNCGWTNHKTEDCYRPGGAKHRPKSNDKAKIAQENDSNNTEEGTQLFLAKDDVPTGPNDWILDSGATRHMSPRADWLQHYTKLVSPIPIEIGDGSTIYGVGLGKVLVETYVDGKPKKTLIRNVLHIPEIKENLLSTNQLVRNGIKITIHDKGAYAINSEGKTCAQWDLKRNQMILRCKILQTDQMNPKSVQYFSAKSEGSSATLDMWHRRLGHIQKSTILQMEKKDLTMDLEIVNTNESKGKCAPCELGKATRKPIPKITATRAAKPLERVFTDVCGPMPTSSRHQGYRYFATFTDDATRFARVFLMKAKSETFQKFKEYLAESERQLESKLKILRSDGGGEYTSQEFEQFLKARGIKHEITNAHTPQENGVSERLNRTLEDMEKAMRFDAKLPDSYWGDAVLYAAHIRNICATTSNKDDMTPYEAWTSRKPSLAHVRRFGSRAFVHIPKEKRTKLDPHSLECTFIGFVENKRAYKLINRNNGRVYESRDVSFDEELTGDYKQTTLKSGDDDNSELLKESQLEKPNPDTNTLTLPRSNPGIAQRTRNIPNLPPGDDSDLTDLEDEPVPPPTKSGPSTRSRGIEPTTTNVPRELQSNLGPYWNDNAQDQAQYTKSVGADQAYVVQDKFFEPETYQEALHCPDSEKWKESIEKELQSLREMDVFEEVPIPKGVKPFGCKFVFKVKTGPNGEIEKYKTRLVAKGYSQRPGFDFDETFSPVARYDSIRLILALAAQLDLELHQIDIKSAYLHGDLDRELYMECPPGFSAKTGTCWRLKHSLYGLK